MSRTTSISGGININSGGVSTGSNVGGNIIVGDALVNQSLARESYLHQLPAPPHDFTGRKTELDELIHAVDRGVTIFGLQGQGGIGKTALALQLVQKLLPLYPAAQFFLDLRGVSDSPLTPAEAMSHVIRAYYPEQRLPDDEGQLKAIYQSVLHDQKALLLMDNAKDKDQVLPLIPPHTCCLIVTSRQHFTLPGLHAQNLEVMSPDDAYDLLIKIAPRLTQYEIRITNELTSLCAYLPLALRAAASTLAEKIDLDPADYAKQLRNEKKRLGLKGVTATTGEISVEASLNLSYARLSANTQRTLQRLSVFPDDFDSHAAEIICDDEGQKSLSELVKRSLADYSDKTTRYKLHYLTRLFASHRLPDDERYAVQLHHAQHYLETLKTAQQLYFKGGDSITNGLALFDLERLNIERGQAWASANAKNDTVAQVCNDYPNAGAYVIQLRLHPRQQIRWIEDALNAARQLKDRYGEGIHLGNLGLAYADLGETHKAIKFYEQQLNIVHEIGDRRGEGNALGNLGLAYTALGETRKAIEFHEQQLKIVREIGDRRGEANALGNLGLAYVDLGEIYNAIEFYGSALIIAREIGDRRNEGNWLSNLGIAYANLGETRKAIEYHEQALIIAREIGDRRNESSGLGNLGLVYADLGEMRKAVEFYNQRLIIAREIGDRRGEGKALGNLGNANAALGETRKAIEYYEQALIITREIGDRRGEESVLGNLGLAYTALGETRKAIEYYEQALIIARDIVDRFGEGKTLSNLGNAYTDLGETRKGTECYESALKIARDVEDSRSISNYSFSLGLIFIDQGRWYDALRLFEECLEIRRKGDDLDARADAIYQIAHIHHLLRNLEKARTYYRDAKRLYEKTNNQKGIAPCNLSLGRLMIQMGFVDDAMQELTIAGEIYRSLDDQSRIDTTDEMMRLAKGIKEKQLA